MTDLVGVGAYAPRLRVSSDAMAEGFGHFGGSGVETKAVPDADEDALTMAAEAGRRALDAAAMDPSDVSLLVVGTTTPPMAEEDIAGRLVSAFGLPADVGTATLTGSTRAGVQALARACADDFEDGVALVVTSDCPRGAPSSDIEHAAGAGAVGFVLSASDGASVSEVAEYTAPYPGTRFRRADSDEVESLDVVQYERDAYRETVTGAVEALDTTPSEVDAAAFQAPDPKRPFQAADALGIDADALRRVWTLDDLGDTGAASALLGLARAMADGADRTLVVGYGSGAGSTALVVERDGSDVPVDMALDGDISLSVSEYLRRRGTITGEEPSGGGAYVSVPSWQRTIDQRHRAVAGRCRDCGMLNFPPEGACTKCLQDAGYAPAPLERIGVIEAMTTIGQGGAPPEFVEQQERQGAYASAIAKFGATDGIGTVSVPLQVVLVGEDSVTNDDRIATALRLVYEQEGVRRYGLKGIPESARR